MKAARSIPVFGQGSILRCAMSQKLLFCDRGKGSMTNSDIFFIQPEALSRHFCGEQFDLKVGIRSCKAPGAAVLRTASCGYAEGDAARATGTGIAVKNTSRPSPALTEQGFIVPGRQAPLEKQACGYSVRQVGTLRPERNKSWSHAAGRILRPMAFPVQRPRGSYQFCTLP